MTYTSAALGVLALALFGGEASAEVTSPDIELTCSGQYLDAESTSGRTSTLDAAGNLRMGIATYNTAAMRGGVARIGIHGGVARLVYPDGTTRIMRDAAADDQHITGSYKRALGLIIWHMDINRVTGDIQIKNALSTAFVGTCSLLPTSTQPKF